jgi:hypothetical protein
MRAAVSACLSAISLPGKNIILNIVLYNIGDGNGAVIVLLFGKASMLFLGSEVVDLKSIFLIKTYLLS